MDFRDFLVFPASDESACSLTLVLAGFFPASGIAVWDVSSMACAAADEAALDAGGLSLVPSSGFFFFTAFV